MNDPNGLCWYRGKYRVFFQWNRLKKDHSYKEWGLFTSENLTKWQFEGSALIPGQDDDRDGVYSGSGQVIGGQRRNLKGAIALCRSANGRRWEDQGTLAVSDQYEMIECPDLFLLDGQWVLLYNPQKRNTETDKPEFRFSAYKLGRFEEPAGNFEDPDLDTDFGELDAGFDFYAPQTLEAPDGRRAGGCFWKG